MSTVRTPLCPSAQPQMDGARLLGVVAQTDEGPRVAYLRESVAVDAALLKQTRAVPATQVLRVAAPCEQKRCAHFDGSDCRLAERIVHFLPAVVETLPACIIRAHCRWFRQEGSEACMRCPQVVTSTVDPSTVVAEVARPQD